MSDADFDGWKRRAKRVRIEDELARRGVRLKTVSRRRDSWQLAGPCPVCGGDDRFSVHPGRQAWNCRHCSRGGDVIELVRVLDNCSFEVACETLTREDRPAVARRTPPVSAKDTRASHAESDAEGTRRALRLWDEGVPLEGTDAELYLQRRRLEIPDRMLASGRMLRFHGACPFGPDVRHPCMMSLFRSITTNTAQGDPAHRGRA